MTQDLRVGSESDSMQLTSEDTDIDFAYSLPRSKLESNDFNTLACDIENIYLYNEDSLAVGYYNYASATAGKGKGKVSGDLEYSICPKGWKLPSQNEYYSLQQRYTATEIQTAIPNFHQGGYVNTGKLYTDQKMWHTSTAVSRSGYCGANYKFIIQNSTIRFDNWTQGYGGKIRCIKR